MQLMIHKIMHKLCNYYYYLTIITIIIIIIKIFIAVKREENHDKIKKFELIF